MASRFLTVEAHLYQAIKDGSFESLHDALVKTLALMPSLEGYDRVPLKKFEETKRLLSRL
ncbi:hypothetical protein [Thermococcus paralvinellae]|uniref:hypothetical protein n=1 Tax=Thermococcus paralvinellae TaxID=582419 RepID=UPI0005B291A1|nr:hypothetical protein [Thermococcus paralvinellae]